MDIKVTTFTNPFSFFCLKTSEDDVSEFTPADHANSTCTNHNISDVNHGQYIAVLNKNKWLRGIVSMESQFLIWLVDVGVFMRPNETTVNIGLPSEYKKLPSKVFEASVRGVVPMDKVLTDDCQIKNEIASTWSKGAMEKAQKLLASAHRTFFVPIALLTTNTNDVVIGDLYLNIPGKGFVNIIDELSLWPVFLEINHEEYVKNMPEYYTSRRKHRACLIKPDFPELPEITTKATLAEYNDICKRSPEFEPTLDYSSEVGSTVVTKDDENAESAFTLTTSEIEEYSQVTCYVNGREYNFLHCLLNKLRDLKMCMRYKNHDLKSVGRANVHRGIHKVQEHDFNFD